MSDPTLPVPQPEPAAPRRRSKRKWVIAIAAALVVLLGVGGAAYAVHAKGDAEAEKYAKALNAWSDQKNDLLGAPADADSELWDFDDASTKKSLAKQKVACQRVLALRKSSAKDAAAVPKASDTFVKLLSADQRKAIKDSAANVRAVKAFAKAADQELVQLHKDCVWNIQVNSVKEGDSGAKKIFVQADTLLLKPGHSVGNYYCPSSSKVSCLPVSLADRTKFAGLILKAIRVDKAYVMKKFFAPGSCDSTSYGNLCGAMKTTLSSYYGNLGDYSAVFKSIDTSSSKLKHEFAQMKKGNKTANAAFKKALFKAHPDFKSEPRVAHNPFWQEAYFDASAQSSIHGFDKLREAVLKVSGNTDSVDVLGELSDTQPR